MTYEIKLNAQYNSNEIYFEGKPSEAIRKALKTLKMRWNHVKGCWYGFASEEEIKAACEGLTAEKQQATTKPKTNKFGVKVGDLFECSWGYEQTNVDFFQVVELVGTSSVRVVEVVPKCIGDNTYSHGMAADRTYKNDGEMLQPIERSSWIDDQKKGDLKRLKSYAADGISNPQFTVSNYANAYLVTGETFTTYVSWYY